MKWLNMGLTVLRVVLEAISRVIFGLIYWGDPHQELPPIRNLLLLESATSLAAKIRARKVIHSCLEWILLFI